MDRKSKGGKRNNTHWIFININESQKRFEIKPDLWNQLRVGDKVLLKLQEGYLDYNFITEIKPTAKIYTTNPN